MSEPARTGEVTGAKTAPVGLRLLRRLAAPWSTPVGVVAALLALIQCIWRGAYLQRGFFTQDDFLMMVRAGHPLSWELLFQNYSGHVMPGGFLIFWVQSAMAPLSWGFSVLVILALQLLAAALMWTVLSRLLPGRWVALPVFAVFLFCPLTLWSTQWWVVAVMFLPLAACLLLAVWALVARIEQPNRWSVPVVLLAVMLGLAFQERGVLIPVVLGFVALGLSEGHGWRQRLVNAIRGHIWLWALLVGGLVGYLLMHRQLAPIHATDAGSAMDGLLLVVNFLFRNVMPGLFGGPWSQRIVGDSLIVPTTWAVASCAVVLVVLVLGTSLRGGFTTVCGWALILVFCLVDVALLFGGRTGMGSAFGLLPRYAADVVPGVAVGLALVARGVLAAQGPLTQGWRRPLQSWIPWVQGRYARVSALTVVLLLIGSSAVSTSFMAPRMYHEFDRRYVETLRAELRSHPQAVIFNGAAPDEIMIGWFAATGRVSTVIGQAPESPVFDVPSYDMRLVGATGLLQRFNLLSTTNARPAPDQVCGYAVTDEPLDVPLAEPVKGDRLVVRIEYYAGSTPGLELEVDGRTQQLPIRVGAHQADFVVSGSFDKVGLRIDEPGATVCVTSLQTGYPVAANQ